MVAARGHLHAPSDLDCVASLDEFEAAVDETFRFGFVPAGTESDDPDPESEDEVPYAGDTLDLGEAAVEQLALALDPYPRKPDAELPAADGDSAGASFRGSGARAAVGLRCRAWRPCRAAARSLAGASAALLDGPARVVARM